MGWGIGWYRHRVYTGVQGHGGRSNPQTRKPTEAVRHRVGLRGQGRYTGGCQRDRTATAISQHRSVMARPARASRSIGL